MSRSDGTGEAIFLDFTPPLQISVCSIEMDEGMVGGWGGHGRSVREWHDPSTWLSASAAASGQMLPGEGNGGADKVWAPTESIEVTVLHLSLKGGCGTLCGESRKLKKKKVERQRFGEKLPTDIFCCCCLAVTGLLVVLILWLGYVL